MPRKELSFDPEYGFRVDDRKYHLPSLFDYEEQSVPRQAEPRVWMEFWNVAKDRRWRGWVLVDTGAPFSILTNEAAKELGINGKQGPRDSLYPVYDADNRLVVGFRRMVEIQVAGHRLAIPVVVGPDPMELRSSGPNSPPLGSAPRFNSLGRAGVLQNLLLCLDARRLHAFPRKVRKRVEWKDR